MARAPTGKQSRGDGGERAGVAAQMQRLREELVSSLSSTISDTIEAVCEGYEERLALAAQSLQSQSAHGGPANPRGKGRANGKMQLDDDAAIPADYDQYYSICNQLVAYIAANMATSPDFKQQMDRIILACHSNASEAVLSSVVTKKLWFHKRGGNAADLEEAEAEDDDDVVEMRVKPSSSRVKAQHTATSVAHRGTKRRASAPPSPPPPPTRSARVKSPLRKRARKDSVGRKSRYAASDESEEEEEEEVIVRKPRRRTSRINYSEEEVEEEDDEDDDEAVTPAAQPHYGQADELLNFKDAIGDMCYADRRTPAQTRFFKDRLRKAIEFVDAQLCKPPKGKVCGWECVKIRRQMCNRDLPCRNKICRLWHDVEAHTDRCQNSHCEFRIRVMLRETMYKIDHKKAELQQFRNELHAKEKALQELKNEHLPDRENFVERRLLDNEIGELESEIDKAEKDIGVFKATKKTYWATLNEIGITKDDDVNDQFPEFMGHYTEKKAVAKKKKTVKKSRNNDAHVLTGALTASSTSRTDRSRRRLSADASASPVAPSPQRRERITRRSTQQSLKVMSNGVIELDDDEDEDEAPDDEESKTDRSAEYDDDATPSRPADAEDSNPQATASEASHGNADGTRDSNDQDVGDAAEEAKLDKTDEDDSDNAAQPESDAANSSTNNEPQSADYVIEPSDAGQPADPASTKDQSESSSKSNSALEAFNEVIASSSALAQEEASFAGDVPTEKATTDENGPLLPF